MNFNKFLKLFETGNAIPVHTNNRLGYAYAHNYRAFWQFVSDELRQYMQTYGETQYLRDSYEHASELANYYALYDSDTPASEELQALIDAIKD